jgi:hypothetical protein
VGKGKKEEEGSVDAAAGRFKGAQRGGREEEWGSQCGVPHGERGSGANALSALDSAVRMAVARQWWERVARRARTYVAWRRKRRG